MQNEPARLQSAFLRSFLLLATAVFFVVALIAALSPDGIPLLLGQRWQAAAPLMPWLAIWGASRAVGAAYSTLFNAMGKPRLTTIYQFIMLIMFAIFIYPMAVRYGADGVAMTVSGIGMIALLTRFPLVARLLKMSALSLFKLTFIPIGAALIGYAVAYATRQGLLETPILVRIAACFVTCVGGFALTLFISDRCGLYPIISTINQVLPARLRMKGV
jgi:O-antigen/teichoic acid export membrane protein